MNDPTNNQPTVTYEIEGYYPATGRFEARYKTWQGPLNTKEQAKDYLKTAIKIGVSKPRIVKVTREIINEEDA